MRNYFLPARMLLVLSIDFSRVFLLMCYFNVVTYLCQKVFVLES